MDNKKGYTLIELLAVIAIIAILAGVATTLIYNYSMKGRENYHVGVERTLEQAARDYFSTRYVELPRGQKDESGNPILSKKIYLSTLEENNTLSGAIKDSNGGACTNSYVVVTKKDNNENNEFDYQACLVCENYKTENSVCK